MISKGKIAGLLALCSLATLTCGFSAWIVGGHNESPGFDFTINGGVGNVIDYGGSFAFNENEATIDKPNAHMSSTAFSYNSYGIVKDNVVTGTAGDFSFYMAVFLKGDKGLFFDNAKIDSFSFDFGFKDKGSFLLLDYLNRVTTTISSGSYSYTLSNLKLLRTDDSVNVSVVCSDSNLLSCNRLFCYTTLTFDFSKKYNSSDAIKFSSIASELTNAKISVMVNYNG